MASAFSMNNSRPTRIPMATNLDLSYIGGDPMPSKKLYQSLLGGLLHINLGSRPDICFAINSLSRETNQATTAHLACLRKVLQYLYHNNDWGLFYHHSKKTKLDITVEVDASYASGPQRRSTFGYIIYINKTPVMFRTKLQNVIALSSCEAELIGISEACKSIGFLENILKFMNIEYNSLLREFMAKQMSGRLPRLIWRSPPSKLW